MSEWESFSVLQTRSKVFALVCRLKIPPKYSCCLFYSFLSCSHCLSYLSCEYASMCACSLKLTNIKLTNVDLFVQNFKIRHSCSKHIDVFLRTFDWAAGCLLSTLNIDLFLLFRMAMEWKRTWINNKKFAYTFRYNKIRTIAISSIINIHHIPLMLHKSLIFSTR